MKVLVTGGTGYLGRHIVAALVEAGHLPRLLVRATSDLEGLPEECGLHQGDVTDPASMASAVRGCEGLIHAAGFVRSWHPDPEPFHEINVRSVTHAVEAGIRAGCERIVVTASIIGLGATGDEIHGAAHLVPRSRFGNLYEETKYRGLVEAQRLASEGAPVVTLCPGILYGPGARTRGNMVAGIAESFLTGRIVPLIAGGKPVWSYAWVEDVARGHVQALERGEAGRRYVLGGENASLSRLYDLLERFSGRRPIRIPVPVWVLKSLGAVDLLRARLTGRTPDLTPGTAEILTSNWAFHSREAVADLGYTETPLAEGIERMLRWLRESSK